MIVVHVKCQKTSSDRPGVDGGSDPVYAQPNKPKLSVENQSNGLSGSSSSAAGQQQLDQSDSSYQSARADGSGVGALDAGSGQSSHYHTVPDPVQLGRTIARSAPRGDQLHGQLIGEFDENGLPLVAKGDCAACGQAISGQVER